MYVKLLGALELIGCRRSLDIGGPRQRTILAMLALGVNRVTPVEQLVEAVWDTDPPSTARGQVQTCISLLRKLFGTAGRPDVIRTHPHGYLLTLSGDELDSELFADLVAQARQQTEHGRIAAAATTLRKALDLWRGPALADIHSGLVRRGAVLLDDQRLSTLEERVRLDLALGRHEEVVNELTALVHEYPLRERLYGYLMLAKYRSGRPAEALEVRRHARAVLVEELGIEPGQELQDLERAILNRDPALDQQPVFPRPVINAGVDEKASSLQPIVPHEVPFSIADFTGRESLIGRIKEALTGESSNELAPYSMRIVAISGVGGVGKSSLAFRVAHEIADQFPDGHLYGEFQNPQGSDTGAVLSRFLRAMGVSGSTIPDDLRERATLYRSTLAGSRVLVVLDDVTSEDQILPLLPGSPTCAVIVTSRRRLAWLPGALRVDVAPFDAARSMELLQKIVGDDRARAEEPAALELIRFCNGLPLALRIAGARLASRPHWRIADLVRRLGNEARRLDEFSHGGLELRASIGLTYRGLPVRAQRLFRLVALVQVRDFPAWTAAALLDTDLLDAVDLLESLVDARMLDTVEYAGNRVRYSCHDLIRVYAQEMLSATESPAQRDAAVARVLGAWLTLSDEAHRKEYGGDFTLLHGDAPRWRPPCQGPSSRSALDWWGAERDWWDNERFAIVAAIRQAAAYGMHDHCWDLALTSVTLFESKGYYELWRESAEIGLAATTQAGNRNGQAAMLYSLGTLHMFQKRLATAGEYFAAALSIFRSEQNTHGCGLVLRNVALIEGLRGDTSAMLSNYERSLTALRAVGDEMGEAQILRSVAKFWIDEGETERGRSLLEEALTICLKVRCLRGEAQVVHQFAHLHLSTGQIKLSRQALHRVLLIVRNIGDRIGEVYALYGLGIVDTRDGRPERAEQTLLHALDLARRVGERLVEGEALYALGELCLSTGRTVAAAKYLAGASRLFEDLGSVLWQARTLSVLSDLHAMNDNLNEAADSLERAARLLAELDSKQAARWLDQIRSSRSALELAAPQRAGRR
ncbi:BTAD domain-containing putative transcriptional regulator [Solwaraspora sp. WMMD937]|uniref:AfsR/SARP family transcriptional regulator n=1 Tax=Solwaraspora sp. WMMD937 TaxID=3016090 RepID=UPI00249A4D87|nr:AfsR/SARP family transcriptional regulator [Solwaraspora sp. WMMD937]WFE24175.1 BTAD domain-containing putative transcriptional regulator [Solwaraspora sp. WMMD937]